jgi:hypothetical protein
MSMRLQDHRSGIDKTDACQDMSLTIALQTLQEWTLPFF